MIIIADDDKTIRTSLTILLRKSGYETIALSTADEILNAIRNTKPQLVLMDMNFSFTTSGEEGLELIRKVKIFHPSVPVILITAWGSISLAVRGMQAGAFDFITKPFNPHQILVSIRTALELTQEDNHIETGVFDKIIGRSTALQKVLDTVSRIAPTDASVLITGESGTGKELIAEAIHYNSKRHNNDFVKVNLGGISSSLFESEMFGHKKGAFTDAYADRIGRFEMADKGTIFLDEIGELELPMQVKLLRVLQEKTFERLGESRTKRVDVRVVSATNQNLNELVEKRLFREDLFYRINLINIHLPPLRDRREDIPLLANHFLQQLAAQVCLNGSSLTKAAELYLESLPFYGNIRELKNLVERALLLSQKELIDVNDLTNMVAQTTDEGGIKTLDSIERCNIEAALQKSGGNLSQTAATLGISRQTLYRRIEKYGIIIKN